jgi:O-succinylhomoserine sulfhydrylase
MLKGLETLELRDRAQSRNALDLARYLEAHAKVQDVLHPGLPSHPQHELARRQMAAGSNLLAFRVGGDQARAFEVMNRLELIAISNNLGDVKSLLTHPGTTTHQRLSAEARVTLGITDDLLRLSVGLEDVEDLMQDLDQALA